MIRICIISFRCVLMSTHSGGLWARSYTNGKEKEKNKREENLSEVEKENDMHEMNLLQERKRLSKHNGFYARRKLKHIIASTSKTSCVFQGTNKL